MAIKKEFLKVKVSQLIPYENNPRINEPAVADTMESIRQCENLDPIEVDENMVILSGHTRMLAMQRLGIAETEVVTQDSRKTRRRSTGFLRTRRRNWLSGILTNLKRNWTVLTLTDSTSWSSTTNIPMALDTSG